DYTIVPRRNAIPLPETLSPLHASVLGTAWLTAYRALFTRSGLRAGETLLVQGATGGMAAALIRPRRAARLEGLVTGRPGEGPGRSAPTRAFLPMRRCRGRCEPSSTASGWTPGLTACRRWLGAARWWRSAARRGLTSR